LKNFRKLRQLLFGAVAVGMLATGVLAPTALGAEDAAGSAPTGVVVVFDPGVPASERTAVREAADTTTVSALGQGRFQLLAPEPGQSVAEAVAALREEPSVVAADPNVSFEPSSIPNDQRFGELWGLLNTGQNVGGFAGAVPGADIDATLAWDRTVGDPSVVVADIDTGYLFGHPDLGPVAWTNPGETPGDGIDNDHNGYVDDRHGWDTADNDNDPTDIEPFVPGPFGGPFDYVPSVSHGVHTAGTIGAQGNNATGVTGVAQNVRIMPIRAGSDGRAIGFSLASVIEAMNYAGANGARVANMSLNIAGVLPTVLAAQAANQKTLFVISAGNEGNDNDASPQSPCDDPTVAVAGYVPPPGVVDNVVCVAATDQADLLAWFSNFGAASVDLAAPGTQTLSTMRERQTVFGWDEDAGGFADWTTPAPPADDNTKGFVLSPTGVFIVTGAHERLGAQQPGTTHATQTPAISVPAAGQCTFRFVTESVQEGDDLFSWALFLDGTKQIERVEPDSHLSSGEDRGMRSGTFEAPPTSSPHTATVQFVFHRGLEGADRAVAGVARLRLDCLVPTYDYLEGTSMAAPHVTGSAGLLFSLKPAATVTQVRNALLAGVDPLPSLAGKTVTGGRLNAWKALAALLPMDTRIKSGQTSGSVNSTNANFTFDTNNTGNAGFQCRLDGSPFLPCTSPQGYKDLSAGKHSFAVRSAVTGGVDATPAIADWTIAKKK
jgi:subtilisin family serine protease